LNTREVLGYIDVCAALMTVGVSSNHTPRAAIRKK